MVLRTCEGCASAAVLNATWRALVNQSDEILDWMYGGLETKAPVREDALFTML
jgi:hypothetical protein